MINNNPHIIQISLLETCFPRKKDFWLKLNSTLQKNFFGLSGFNWHESIFIPTQVGINLINGELKPLLTPKTSLDLNDALYYTAFLSSFLTITSWRYSQGCYFINDYTMSQLFNENAGSIISPNHIKNIKEWTIYIPFNDLEIDSKKVHGIYVHKNIFDQFENTDETNALFVTFNTLPDDNYEHYTPMPFVILDTRELALPIDKILSYGGFKKKHIEEIIPSLLSIINLIGDENTIIESNFVGIKKPNYSDVQRHLNFNDFNIPSFKLSAPSNRRIWETGLNLLTEHKKQVRTLGESNAYKAHWKFQNNQLTLSI